MTEMLELDKTGSKLPVARFKITGLNSEGPQIGQTLADAMAKRRPIVVDLAEMHSRSLAVGCLRESEPWPSRRAIDDLATAHVAACRAGLPLVIVRVSRRWRDSLQMATLDAALLSPFYRIASRFRHDVFEHLGRLFSDASANVDAAVTNADRIDETAERDFTRRYGMPSSELRERFRVSVTPGEFDRFSVSLVDHQQTRLRYWQEKAWERFRDGFSAAPSEVADVFFAMASRCSLHGCRKTSDWRAGCILQLHHWDLLKRTDDSTTMSTFPFADGNSPFATCSSVCPKCVAARMRWLAERIPEVSTTDPHHAGI